ncbi:MAG TPA: hypothetical protein VFX46_04290, partial [Hyphomicrobiaceae bacterium]|nr:hypothetical protein [Hyphomicrobiaceae bacterium]
MVESSGAGSSAATLPYRQDIDGVLEGAIGSYGLGESELRGWLGKLEPALDDLRKDWETGSLAILRIPEETSDIAPAEAAIANLMEGASTVLFFGTGGSSLGGQTLAQLAGWNIPGAADEA